VKKQFMVTRKVPIPVGGRSEDQPFVAVVRKAKSVTQTADSFSFNHPAPVHIESAGDLSPDSQYLDVQATHGM
jgi:hypothetical protein